MDTNTWSSPRQRGRIKSPIYSIIWPTEFRLNSFGAAQLTIMQSHAIDVITPPTLLGPKVRLGLRLSLSESPTISSFDRFAQMATQLPAGTNLDSPQIKLWIEFAQAFKPMNVDSLRKCLHKDFRHVSLPRSIGEPERNKEEWVEAMEGFFKSITVFEVGNPKFPFSWLAKNPFCSRPSILSPRPQGRS